MYIGKRKFMANIIKVWQNKINVNLVNINIFGVFFLLPDFFRALNKNKNSVFKKN